MECVPVGLRPVSRRREYLFYFNCGNLGIVLWLPFSRADRLHAVPHAPCDVTCGSVHTVRVGR